ncbi:MAG: hypothetical protein GY847_00400 [Proteobacteria bacterium]|nr:hypothetical protein [Pseudomonadota bacterium]
MISSREKREVSSINKIGATSDEDHDSDIAFQSKNGENAFSYLGRSDDAFAASGNFDGSFEGHSAFMSSSIFSMAGLVSSGKSAGVQAKLEVGEPDDPLEREADEVSEKVMRMPEDGASTGGM